MIGLNVKSSSNCKNIFRKCVTQISLSFNRAVIFVWKIREVQGFVLLGWQVDFQPEMLVLLVPKFPGTDPEPQFPHENFPHTSEAQFQSSRHEKSLHSSFKLFTIP